jgi:hypothetical protein
MTANKKAVPSVQTDQPDETVFQNIRNWLCCALTPILETTGKEAGGHDECRKNL